MRIGSLSFTENVYQLYQKNQSGKPQETTYQELLQAAVGDVQNAQEPRLQIWSDYQEWKKQQPAREVPNSQGSNDENIAFLRENFSGELSMFQRIEAVDTMREMGIITEEQMMKSLGFGVYSLYTVDMDNPIICTGAPGNDKYLHSWNLFFSGSPLMKADSLDALFELLDMQLRSDAETDVAGKTQRILDKVTRKVHE